MITIDAGQQALAAGVFKKIYWKFDVVTLTPTTYRWSHRAFNDGSNNYLAKIVKGSFSGVKMKVAGDELGLIANTDTSFRVADVAGDYTPSDFVGAAVTITFRIGNASTADDICAWKYEVVNAYKFEGEITLECRGYIAKFIEGEYPNTKLVQTIFPSTNIPKPDTNTFGGISGICSPVTFGTAYCPTAPVYVQADDETYYLLGEGVESDYTVSAIHSPGSKGESEWTTAGGTTINKYTKASGGQNYTVAEPIIADSDGDNTVDASGFWKDGDYFLPAPMLFSKAATSALTNPSEVIYYILRQFGIATGDLDLAGSFTDADTVFDGLSLEYENALWRKESRQKILASLLWPANAYLLHADTIGLFVRSTTSVRTLDAGDITDGTFQKSKITAEVTDSGHVSFVPDGSPLDVMRTITISAKSGTSYPSGDTFENRWVRDTQDVQRGAILALQRKLLGADEVSFDAGYSQIALRPEDYITIDSGRFGPSFDMRITEMTVTEAGGIRFSGIRYSVTMDDWSDLSPDAATFETATEPAVWQTTFYGPDATPTSGLAPNDLAGRIRFRTDGAIYSYGKDAFADATAGFFIGYDIPETDYVLDIGSNSSYIRWDGAALSVRMASGETFDLYGGLTVYEGGDITLIKDTSNPAIIYFKDVSGNILTQIYNNYVSDDFIIRPGRDGATGAINLYIGTSSHRWDEIILRSEKSVGMIAYEDLNNFSSMQCNTSNEFVALSSSSSGVYITFTVDSTNNRYEFSSWNSSTKIYFTTDNQIDIGDATHRPKDVYIAGDVAIGVASPDSILHVWGATAGTVTAAVGTIVTIENSSSALLSFLTPNTSTSGIYFGDVDDNDVGYIRYNHLADIFQFRANATSCMTLSDTKAIFLTPDVGIGGDITPDSLLHVWGGTAGSVTAAANTIATFENSGTFYVSLLCPAANSAGFLFGTTTDSAAGYILYSHNGANPDYLEFDFSGSARVIMQNNKLRPSSAAGLDLGDSTYYWNGVNYKTLTDRGCLADFSDGVELETGEKVTATKALKGIKKEKSKLTVYGEPKIDYSSFPKSVYQKAKMNGVELPRKGNGKGKPYYIDPETGEEIDAEDGAELTALVSIMIQAIKENSARLDTIEAL